jgi:hypothetical protein
MNATLGGVWILHFEVPVHVAGLLLFPLWCVVESAPASDTLVGFCLVQSRYKVEPWPVHN